MNHYRMWCASACFGCLFVCCCWRWWSAFMRSIQLSFEYIYYISIFTVVAIVCSNFGIYFDVKIVSYPTSVSLSLSHTDSYTIHYTAHSTQQSASSFLIDDVANFMLFIVSFQIVVDVFVYFNLLMCSPIAIFVVAVVVLLCEYLCVNNK